MMDFDRILTYVLLRSRQEPEWREQVKYDWRTQVLVTFLQFCLLAFMIAAFLAVWYSFIKYGKPLGDSPWYAPWLFFVSLGVTIATGFGVYRVAYDLWNPKGPLAPRERAFYHWAEKFLAEGTGTHVVMMVPRGAPPGALKAEAGAFARFVRMAAINPSWAAMQDVVLLEQYKHFRDLLLASGYAEWVDEKAGQWKLTANPEVILQHFHWPGLEEESHE